MNSELDAQVAERIMGLIPCRPAEAFAHEGITDVWDPERRRYRILPPYSDSLDDASEAEKRLRSTRPELWRAYINALAAETGFHPGMPTLASMERFATASAEVRCRVMLQVITPSTFPGGVVP